MPPTWPKLYPQKHFASLEFWSIATLVVLGAVMPMSPSSSSVHRAGPLSILLVTAWAVAACGNGNTVAAPSAVKPRPVLVATVQQAPLGGQSFAGEVRARERAELAFAVAGVIKEVTVDLGATVRRGQLLARIDATPQLAQLAAAEAENRRLQAMLSDAQRREQRLKEARESGAASEAEWTAVHAEVQAAHAAVAAAQAQRTAAAWNREHSELRAPFDGRIAMRQLEVGQTVGAGAPVLGLEGRGRELWLAVPGNLQLTPGQTLSMTGPSGNAEGRVLQTAGRLEAGGTRRVLLSAPDTWFTGEAVTVQLWPRDPASSALLVPLRAVQMDTARSGHGQVWRLPSGAQVPEQVAVVLGTAQGDKVEVRQGLKPGEQIVLAGGQALTAGQPVVPVERLR